MRILGFERSTSACNHYRIIQPLYKLQEHELADILTIHQNNASDIGFVTEKIMEADIILIPRPQDDRWFDLIKVAQKNGKIIVADFDDHPFVISPFNPAYRHYGTSEFDYKWPDGTVTPIWKNGEKEFHVDENITRQDYFKAAFKRADMISTTTPELQDIFLKLNKSSVVLPNLIDFALYPKLECVKKEIRIGWQGGVSHYEDLYMLAPAIKEIIKKYDNVKFIFLGDVRFYGLFKDIPRDRIEWHPWVQNVVYPYKLVTLNLDIVLCPLLDNEFNRNKSAIKYFEYSAIRIPTIASNVSPYSPVMVNEENGLLISDDQWFDAMERLIKDKELRNKLSDKAFENVYQNHNADKFAYLWRDAYEKLLKKDVAELVEA
jgi:glycosyltransferase involved in cell wall biosynthesis